MAGCGNGGGELVPVLGELPDLQTHETVLKKI